MNDATTILLAAVIVLIVLMLAGVFGIVAIERRARQAHRRNDPRAQSRRDKVRQWAER